GARGSRRGAANTGRARRACQWTCGTRPARGRRARPLRRGSPAALWTAAQRTIRGPCRGSAPFPSSARIPGRSSSMILLSERPARGARGAGGPAPCRRTPARPALPALPRRGWLELAGERLEQLAPMRVQEEVAARQGLERERGGGLIPPCGERLGRRERVVCAAEGG